ncbi:hypothetical protein R1flu_026181 [Riccia fluitans]|uniref:Uncharacterized protein n=1 Tax=Riccia fluitans TaxID=41844 RepID=A0ABD1XFY9_9MARC
MGRGGHGDCHWRLAVPAAGEVVYGRRRIRQAGSLRERTRSGNSNWLRRREMVGAGKSPERQTERFFFLTTEKKRSGEERMLAGAAGREEEVFCCSPDERVSCAGDEPVYIVVTELRGTTYLLACAILDVVDYHSESI